MIMTRFWRVFFDWKDGLRGCFNIKVVDLFIFYRVRFVVFFIVYDEFVFYNSSGMVCARGGWGVIYVGGGLGVGCSI